MHTQAPTADHIYCCPQGVEEPRATKPKTHRYCLVSRCHSNSHTGGVSLHRYEYSIGLGQSNPNSGLQSDKNLDDVKSAINE